MAKDAKVTTVKLRTEIVRKARVIVAIRDIQLTDFLSDVLEPIIEREHAKALEEATKGRGKKNGRAE